MFISNLFKSNREKNEEIYETYLQSKISKSMDTANTTFRTYKSNMKMFLDWFHSEDKGYYFFSKKMLRELPDIMDRYALYCINERGNNKVTVNNKTVTMSSFYIWAKRTRRIEYNPLSDFERQQKWQLDTRRKSYFLTIDQVKTIKETMKEDPAFDIQSRLLFNIFIDSAIRIGELMRLSMENLDKETWTFKNIRQKGGELRDVVLSKETIEILKEFLEKRKEAGVKIPALLVTKYGGKHKPMSREAVRARVKKMGEIIGIPDLYPHTLRKTTVNIITKLGTIEDGALIAHHKSTTVTKNHYVEPISEEERIARLTRIRQLAGF